VPRGGSTGEAEAAETNITSLSEETPSVLRAAHALHDPGCCRLLDEAESLPRHRLFESVRGVG